MVLVWLWLAVNWGQVRFLSPYLVESNHPCRYKGKTTFLYLSIIESLIEGHPFLYQTKDKAVYHVTQEGVEVIWPSWNSKTHIVAFVDADEMDSTPHDIIMSSPLVQIIAVTTLRGAYHKWLKQMGLNIRFNKIATSLWSPCELFLTGLVLIFLLPMLD